MGILRAIVEDSHRRRILAINPASFQPSLSVPSRCEHLPFADLPNDLSAKAQLHAHPKTNLIMSLLVYLPSCKSTKIRQTKSFAHHFSELSTPLCMLNLRAPPLSSPDQCCTCPGGHYAHHGSDDIDHYHGITLLGMPGSSWHTSHRWCCFPIEAGNFPLPASQPEAATQQGSIWDQLWIT